MNDFETVLMERLGSTQNADAKKLKRWLDKNPKGPLRRKVMRQMQAQVEAVTGTAGVKVTAIDWESVFARIGPFIKLLLSLFA